MANSTYGIFMQKKVNVAKLVPFGFEQRDGAYEYSRVLEGSGFVMTVKITADGEVSAKVVDPAFNESYTLHLAGGAAGGFVGGVRSRYEETLAEIAESCFEPDVFKTEQARLLLEHAKAKYGDEPEFLWQKFPNNAVLHRKDTKKWYAALLSVSKRKLGLDSDGMAEIIDLRIAPSELDALIDGKLYFAGYHMNKKNWYTMILDGGVESGEICRRLDESYLLAAK